MTETPYRTALIVGVGSGLSASLARLFAKNGMKVALGARRADGLAALAQEIGGKAFACNAADPATSPSCSPGRSRFRRAGRGRLQCELSHARTARRTRPRRGCEIDRGQRFRRLPGRAAGGEAYAAQRSRSRPRRGHFHRRLGEREGLCPVGAVRHGQVRAARTRAEHGARTAAARHPCRACRHRRRHSQRAAGPIRPTSPTACSIPTPSRRAICICCNSRAAPGPGRSSCAHGWKGFDR